MLKYFQDTAKIDFVKRKMGDKTKVGDSFYFANGQEDFMLCLAMRTINPKLRSQSIWKRRSCLTRPMTASTPNGEQGRSNQSRRSD